jgi:hypothetical protein
MYGGGPSIFFAPRKIGPAVTRAPPGMQNMSKIMAKMSTCHSTCKHSRALSPWWPQSLPSLAQGVTEAVRLPSWSGRWFWGARLHRRCHRRALGTRVTKQEKLTGIFSKNIDRTVKSVHVFISDCVRSLVRMAYCAATGFQYQEYLKLCLPAS